MKFGGPATGSDFYGRGEVIRELWRYLETDHLCFPGVRRLGKTSILQRLVEEAGDYGLYARWLDVADVDSAQGFIAAVESQFPEGLLTRFAHARGKEMRAWLERLEKIGLTLPEILGGGGVELALRPAAAADWAQAAQALHQRLQHRPLLILLDEFPKMLEKILARDRAEAEQLLGWLRRWRQQGSYCRFVFTGSIGLQSLLERHNLSGTMNDCFTYPLGPFRESEARGLWQHFAPISDDLPWALEDSVVNHALGRLGWWSPYFLCLLLDATLRAARERRQESGAAADAPCILSVADVEDGYESLLAERSRFQHWEKRLRDALPVDEFTFCVALLTQLSRQPDGLTLAQLGSRLAKREPDPDRRAERLQTLLIRLTDEGYTSPVDNTRRIRFLSFPLRDWWSRNHV